MSKLKIFHNNDTAANPPVPSKDGYKNVGREFVKNFDDFERKGDNDRPDLLRKYANTNADGTTGNYVIYQLTRGNRPGDRVNEAIDNNNCSVKITPDERRGNGNARGKHNIVLPKKEADDAALSTGYLAGYVKAIAELYGNGSNAEVKDACDFLFGIMLLTRCR